MVTVQENNEVERRDGNAGDGRGPSRREAWKMFDRIAHRYDLLNRLLSFGRDIAWRKKVVAALPEGTNLHLLDLAAGTADVLLTIRQRSHRVVYAVGADMSHEMLKLGQAKIERQSRAEDNHLVRGDATCLPFADGAFDVVTIAFGIRNFVDIRLALREILRVLRPGGRLLILEFSLPSNCLMRRLYLFYFRHILPRIGGAVSGDTYAYRYLNRTVESFPYGREFCTIMQDEGFVNVDHDPLTFGVATLYRGDND